MITADERELAFIAKLKTLLEASGAELHVTDDGKGYGMQTGVCRISMESVYNYQTDKLEKDFCEFELPTYMSGH